MSLFERTISSFPISIGTSLALESVFNPRIEVYDKTREIPLKINLDSYKNIYINVSTLFRNLSGSVNKDVFNNSSEYDLLETLEFEMDTINSLFINEGFNKVKPIYYVCNYSTLFKTLHKKKVLLRSDNTPNQIYYSNRLNSCIKLLKSSHSNFLSASNILDYEIKTKERVNALIMTHQPYDLLSYTNFNKLDLLESHTGLLKSRNLWYTKYMGMTSENMSILPFNRKLLYVFGDKTLIHPSNIRLRKLILEIANKYNWTSMTTLDKINLDLEMGVREPFVLKYLKTL
jgi:hypothetical protein